MRYYNEDEMQDWISDKSENFYDCVKSILKSDILSVDIAHTIAQGCIDSDTASEFLNTFDLHESDAYCFLYDFKFYDKKNNHMEKKIEKLWDKYQIDYLESKIDTDAPDNYDSYY